MSDRILAATHKGLFTIDRARGGWTISRADFLGDSLSMVLPDSRDGAVYAAFRHGHFGPKLKRSRDGGATWEECAVPVYPEPGPGEEHTDQMGKTIAWKLERIWALEPGLRSQSGLLWCGTIPGGLFRSADGGGSWDLVRPLWDEPKRKGWFGGGADLPGIHSICVDPRDGRHITLGVSCGGVWETTDGGETWAGKAQGMRAAYMPPEMQFEPNIQDPHRVVQCQDRPECLWAQHHNGIFRSTDGSASWQEIKDVAPSVFGFGVAVHPHDPDTAWFVPGVKDECRVAVDGKVCVTRTRDGGQTFTTLSKGLPQSHAYDLTYRHALDVDEHGQSLAFGTTTGSLWVSDDQGDSWQALSEHLPPIHCVRFAKPTP